jgi:hypothetical protein
VDQPQEPILAEVVQAEQPASVEESQQQAPAIKLKVKPQSSDPKGGLFCSTHKEWFKTCPEWISHIEKDTHSGEEHYLSHFFFKVYWTACEVQGCNTWSFYNDVDWWTNHLRNYHWCKAHNLAVIDLGAHVKEQRHFACTYPDCEDGFQVDRKSKTAHRDFKRHMKQHGYPWQEA